MTSNSSTVVSSTRQIARAATLVIVLFIISRFTGLLREMIIGARFGTSPQLDAYLAAFRVPDLLFQLIAGGALGSAFIPVFTGYLARKDLPGAWRLFSAIANLIVLLMTATAIVAAIFAPYLVHYVLAPGFTPAQQILTTSLMRLMLVSTIIFGLSGLLMGVLNSFQHFLLPALGPVLYNVCIIAGAWFLAPTLGVYGLVVGVIVGAILHLSAQVIGVWWLHARWLPILGLGDRDVHEVGRLMVPRMLGLAAVQVNFWINTILASSLAPGSLSALNYGWLLMLLPQGIIAQGVATAAFPTFANLEARGLHEELKHTLTTTLRGVLFLTIPATVGLFIWRVPLIRMLLERGQFDARSTQLTAYALAFYSIGLIAHSMVEILARAFYALHDTRTPVIVSVSAMGLNAVLSLLLVGSLSFGGLALANTIATGIEMILLFWLLTSRLHGLDWPAISWTIMRSAGAALVMALALVWVLGRWGGGSVLLVGAGGLLVGGIVYLACAALMRMPEVSALRLIAARR